MPFEQNRDGVISSDLYLDKLIDSITVVSTTSRNPFFYFNTHYTIYIILYYIIQNVNEKLILN